VCRHAGLKEPVCVRAHTFSGGTRNGKATSKARLWMAQKRRSPKIAKNRDHINGSCSDGSDPNNSRRNGINSREEKENPKSTEKHKVVGYSQTNAFMLQRIAPKFMQRLNDAIGLASHGLHLAFVHLTCTLDTSSIIQARGDVC